ncbi:BRO family protein [Pantoea sp.]|uniref:BRO-N domain-containing protein n=1 Tax=Pantoea sp. TaxID=69393 RepID=UPI0028A9B951|nr:BRO family protein [Pantoea sp.]
MKTQTYPSTFNFESSASIRAFSINGAPWFIAKDVCKALGIAHSGSAMRVLDSEEKGVHSTHTPGGQQELTVISESGLYTLILRCRDAVTPGTISFRFRKWVTSEVLPSIRKTSSYSMRQPEMLGDLAGTATTLNVRDARRNKKETDLKAAARIAEKCIPVIMKEMRDHQYHYSNCDLGPAEVIPALLSDARNGLQLRSLLSELADNNHDVSGAWRELEAIRHHLLEQRKVMNDLATHGQYIARLAAK